MIGLMFLLAFGIYLAVSAWVVKATVHWARRTGRGVKRWGFVAAFVMYLLVFWDHIPTLLLHKYYCATKAGFWVYKTPDQWKRENPGWAETLTWQSNAPDYQSPNITHGYRLNERFAWVIKTDESLVLPVRVSYETIVDLANNEVAIKRVNVGAGYIGRFEMLRFWTSLKPCISGKNEFGLYLDEFHQMGREIK